LQITRFDGIILPSIAGILLDEDMPEYLENTFYFFYVMISNLVWSVTLSW